MPKDCGTPSKLPNVVQLIKDKMNQSADAVAEDVIRASYMREESVSQAAVFPGRAADGTQLFVDKRGTNTTEFADFLKANHNADAEMLKVLGNLAGGGFQNPDWMISKKSPPAAFEFYEVKPNNATGRSDGLKKMRSIKVLLGTIHLDQYEGGRFYAPRNREQELFRIDTPTSETIVSIKWTVSTEPTTENGLLVYEICSEVREKKQVPKFPPPIIVQKRPSKSEKARKQEEATQLSLGMTVLMLVGLAVAEIVYEFAH